MIRLSLGNVGSGKTVSEVRNMILNPSKRKTFSNIYTKKVSHNIRIRPEDIIKKNIVKEQKKRDGTIEAIYKHELNKEFWINIKEPINLILDEAHTLMNPRRAMSKINIIMTDYLALIRRILGEDSRGHGEAVFITQLPRRLDPITREMAHEVRWHRLHKQKICKKCNLKFNMTSDDPEDIYSCLQCKGTLRSINYIVEVWRFNSYDRLEAWRFSGRKSYFDHYYITDIEKYFGYYNTLQWDNMFSEFY